MTTAQRRSFPRTGRIGAAALILLGAASLAQADSALKIRGAQTVPIAWPQMDGWADDDHDAAFATFLKSCKAILGEKPTRTSRPMRRGLYEACGKAVAANPHRPGEARAFFEQNFHPVRISPVGDPDGFLTGYYEPIADGVRQQGDGYDYPLYRKPGNLLPGGRMAVGTVVTVHKGKKKTRRKLVPFYGRAAIDDGVLAGRDLEICWLKDPIDSFFAHIQGSVRVRLHDGQTLRLNYVAANGHPYYAVGRWLVDRNIVPKDEMSMDRIREWMERHPQEGSELRRRNASYVFFRQTNLASDEEPVGAQGISLTPGRSIAVDHRLHVYGTPFFISAKLPIESLKPETPFARLMIAQDTGGAIVGPARADIYFGAGDEAGSVSGRLRHPGRFVMLVPNGIDAPAEIPLPRPRPKIPGSPSVPVAATDKAKPAAPVRVEAKATAVSDKAGPNKPATKSTAVKTATRTEPAKKPDLKKPEAKTSQPHQKAHEKKTGGKKARKETRSADASLKSIITGIVAPASSAKHGKKGRHRHKPRS
jgi:membrane-bound lytic murein transglycosylase A